MIYIISDTHFFHNNIQRLAGRPDNWQELIIDNWNRRVTKYDDVIHVGDFALSSKEDFTSVRHQLNGFIYLIKGNHDKQNVKFYQDNSIRLLPNYYTDKYLFPNTIFTHRPIEGNFKYKLNIHGHTHEKNIEDGRHFNVSVENINYTPITFAEILERM